MADVTLEDKFNYHAPSEEGVTKHATLSDEFVKIAALVSDTCPIGREQSLALTKLEEAKFWSSAGVARNPETR